MSAGAGHPWPERGPDPGPEGGLWAGRVRTCRHSSSSFCLGYSRARLLPRLGLAPRAELSAVTPGRALMSSSSAQAQTGPNVRSEAYRRRGLGLGLSSVPSGLCWALTVQCLSTASDRHAASTTVLSALVRHGPASSHGLEHIRQRSAAICYKPTT